jgi:predicted nucleotidyltransferase
LRVADRAAALLQKDFGADRVVLFGSASEPDRFHEHSDLDIAVWGVAEGKYLRAVARLLSLDPGISVDLVRVESASISLQTSIERDGVEL